MTGSEDFRFIFFGIDFGGMGSPGVEPRGPGSGGAIFLGRFHSSLYAIARKFDIGLELLHRASSSCNEAVPEVSSKPK